MRLDDPMLDSIAQETRDAWLVEAARHQIAFMRAKVPYWQQRLSAAAVDERAIESLVDLARVPILSKDELRALRPSTLLPKESLPRLQIGRWTSGTSGQPTVNFWSETDWAALVASTSRMLARQAPMTRPTAFNVYSDAHVTGPLYDGALRKLGGVVYDRSQHPEEFFPKLAQTELFDFDTLVIPAQPCSTSLVPAGSRHRVCAAYNESDRQADSRCARAESGQFRLMRAASAPARAIRDRHTRIRRHPDRRLRPTNW
jgi:phenylacetate-coenzyme A ligase PaaK-like adenylate-forming protein